MISQLTLGWGLACVRAGTCSTWRSSAAQGATVMEARATPRLRSRAYTHAAALSFL